LPLASAQQVLTFQTRKVSEERFQAALAAWNADAPEGWDKWWAREEILLHEKLKVEPEPTGEVQAIEVGPAVFVSNPAEYFCQFGLNIKARSPFPFTWVVELANGSIGYVPTPEAMGPQGGGYEPRLCCSSCLVPEAGQQIEDASVALAASLTPSAAPEPPQIQGVGARWQASASSDDV
jgi:hypothetical protein